MKKPSELARQIAERAADMSDDCGRYDHFDESRFAAIVDEMLKGKNTPELEKENEQLRRRIEDTEDALRREVRKNLKAGAV